MRPCTLTASLLGAFLLANPAGLPPATAATPCIDVALVLAVDTSASVSATEYGLQRDGIAAAFRDQGVLQAISQAGKVAVAVVFWGAERSPKPQSAWVLIDGADAAERFSRAVEATPRQVTGDTGLGAGLMASLVKFGTLEQCSLRKIVNVSGDGEETRAIRGKTRDMSPPLVRDMAQSLEVEINALAIANVEHGLPDYYEANVITGPDAFVMVAEDYDDFAEALRRKLIREISPRVVSGLDRPSAQRMP